MLRHFSASRRTPALTALIPVLALLAGLFLLPAPARASVTPVETYPNNPINTGDHAWMLTSSALVLMMTGPGLALFYSGLVRRKNVLATMMQSFILMAVVSVVWALDRLQPRLLHRQPVHRRLPLRGAARRLHRPQRVRHRPSRTTRGWSTSSCSRSSRRP